MPRKEVAMPRHRKVRTWRSARALAVHTRTPEALMAAGILVVLAALVVALRRGCS